MKFSSQAKQLSLDIFSTSLEKSLAPSNRWYRLANSMPWAKIERIYNKRLDNKHCGGGNKPARMVIGALIIKHKMNLSDEETIQIIAENPYMQYFVGLEVFTNKPIFDSSLFVYIRKRIDVDSFNEISLALMEEEGLENEQEMDGHDGEGDNGKCDDDGDAGVIVADGDGYTFIDHFSWDAYNESVDLKRHVTLYRERFGCLPEVCYADRIYMNRENRAFLKQHHIKAAGKPLGRPSKEMQTEEYKAQSAKDMGERNEVESTFGTAKRVYRANDLRAKLPDTADAWTAACFMVKNVMKFLRGLLFVLLQMMKMIYKKPNHLINIEISYPIRGVV